MNGLANLVGRQGVLAYARRPLNVALLVVVPILIVFVWAGALADFSKVILGGAGDRAQVEAATAGWAAAALAGLAGFFQVIGSRSPDRRLAAAGGHSAPIAAGRLGATFGLAVLATVGGLTALAARTGITDPPRAVAATGMVAIIYLAFGVLVGTVVRSEMNGALLITLLWVFDIFLGPALGPDSSLLTRFFPLHFPTLVLIGQASGHAGPIGDVGWSIAWALGLAAVATARLAGMIRPTPPPNTPVAAIAAPAPSALLRQAVAVARSATPTRTRPLSSSQRWIAVLRAGLREYRRNLVLWALLVVVPAVFIGMAILVTVDVPGPIALVEGNQNFVALLSQRRMHAATMVPITSAFLAGIAGLFVVTDSADGDRRLVLAGLRTKQVLAGRVGVIAAATALTTVAAIAVSGLWYAPRQWLVFAGANLLIALTYAVIGVLVGPITGRIGGLYLILMLAFIDVGLGQSVMLPEGPPTWGAFLPARGASQVMIDGAFTAGFDRIRALLLGLAWLAALGAAATAVFHRRTRAVKLRQNVVVDPGIDTRGDDQ
ncbi:MAG: ABC transporter permease [Actinobacteria bacterium]|nr:ABC transporter permease [Actinomycetota bacterium]